MKESVNNWKYQSLLFSEKMKDALIQQHIAAQFIAMAGHSLIPQQPDDSNTNMDFVPLNNILLGNLIEGKIRIGLYLPKLQIMLCDAENNILNIIFLDGKSKTEVFDEIKNSLQKLNIDTQNFKQELHYQIPDTYPQTNFRFHADEDSLNENAIYRFNANLILSEFADQYNLRQEVKIWPHHFDTGFFNGLENNEKGELIKSLGLGFAIPDTMIDEPYYYLSFWSANGTFKPSKTELNHGKWMMPNWNGGVLTTSEINSALSADEQKLKVESFFNEGLKSLNINK